MLEYKRPKMLTWVTRWVRSICWWCRWLAWFCWLLQKNGWSSNLVEFCSLYLWLKRKFLHIEKYPFFRVASKYLQLWIFVLWATVQRGEKKKYWMKMVKHHNAVHTIYGWRAPPDYIAPATKKKISKTALFQGFPMSNWDGWLLSPSGDLGIGLVRDNPTPPHPGPDPHFGLTVEILFKVN